MNPLVVLEVKGPMVNEPATRLMLPWKVQFLHLTLMPPDLAQKVRQKRQPPMQTETYIFGPLTDS